jgi:hypothetical protein
MSILAFLATDRIRRDSLLYRSALGSIGQMSPCVVIPDACLATGGDPQLRRLIPDLPVRPARRDAGELRQRR